MRPAVEAGYTVRMNVRALAEQGRVAAKPLSNSAFFARVAARLDGELPPDLGTIQVNALSYLMKIHFGNERVHYEVWPDRMRGKIEIGLHFEDGPVSTAAYLRYFDARIVALKDGLGAEVELERWTSSWGHLFYLLPWAPFDAETADEAATRLIRLIAALQPLVEAAAVPRESVERPSGPRRFYRHSRAAR